MEASPLEVLLNNSIDGDPEILTGFFKGLLRSSIYVVRRQQHLPLSDAPEYPNPLFDVLGVQGVSKVVIPVFLHKDRIREWSATDLQNREMNFKDLLEIVPDGWWLVINPGWEVEKELSPWELSQLKLGDEALKELVDDNLPDDTDKGVFLEAVDPQEFKGLIQELVQYSEQCSQIEKIAIYRERVSTEGYAPVKEDADIGVTRDSIEGQGSLMVAVRLVNQSDAARIRDELFAIAQKAMIGSLAIKVLTDSRMVSSLAGEMAEGFGVIYKRKGALRSFLDRINFRKHNK